MYYQPLLNDVENDLQQEVRRFVREEVSPDFIRALDRDEIKYPREFVEKLARACTYLEPTSKKSVF
jgi:acyl-CoA dehydrogenase